MSCINEEQIQQYLDQEYSLQESEVIRQHLEICSLCSEALIQQRQWSLDVKKSLDQLVTQQPDIPPFKVPGIRKNHRVITSRYILPLAIAAGILLLVLLRPFISSDTPITRYPNLHYVESAELDANKPITDYPLIMTIVAPDGSVSQVQLN
jgi:hypothetical protein